jgi:serine/threonine-protein kinase
MDMIGCHIIGRASKYTILKFLDSGGFGRVFSAKDSLGKLVAIKEIRNDGTSFTGNSELEAFRIAKGLENVIQLIDETVYNSVIFIIMEYCDGGTLTKTILNEHGMRMDESKALPYMFQIAKGVYELHTRELVHRDLKPDNIMLTKNGLCKIGDLGLVGKTLADSYSRVVKVQDTIWHPKYLTTKNIQQKLTSFLWD